MLLHALILVLESLFFVGLAGSLVVAIWAFVGDIHVFFDKDEKDKTVMPKDKSVIPSHAQQVQSH